MQISAEQLLRESTARLSTQIVPKQKIADIDELNDYRMKKRKQFEDLVKNDRVKVGNWLKYAAWEEAQNEFER